jgi:hypothetical protein
MVKKREIVIAVIFFLLGLGLMYSYSKSQTKSLNISNNKLSTPTNEISINYLETVVNGATESEEKNIESFIDGFEKYEYRDADKVLASFVAPESKEEQEEVDGFLGKDVPLKANEKPIPYLWTSHSYNHTVLKHYIREINKTLDKLLIRVEELRCYNYNGEGSSGFIVNKQNLIFELKEINGEYKIQKYYHEGRNSKYDGLMVS